MEVKNPMVDQLLVNTAAQTPANPNANKAKDADAPDFDSMVNQKRSAGEKNEAKAEKPDAKPVKGEAPKEEQPVADEQYAIAAAMMFQAQPDARYTAIQAEAPIEAVPEPAVETAQPVEAEIPVEAAEIPAELAEQAAPEAAELPRQPVETERPSETPAEAGREAPSEARPEAAEQTELERNEPQPERATRATEAEAPREERVPEAPRAERGGERTEDADEALAAQGTPVFEHVETPVVKVAEASRPIPLEAEDGVEQLGQELDGVLVNSVDANRIEVTLTPENLGKLTVEITRGEDGTLNVVLHTTTERAANLLEKGVDGLRQALTASRQAEVQVQVRGSEESQRQFLNPDGQNERNQQQQQQQNGRRREQRSAQEFLQQLRLGLVDVDNNEE